MSNLSSSGVPRYRSPLVYAIILHVILFAFLFWHFVSPSLPQTLLQPDVDIIKAVAVSSQQLKTQMAEAAAKQQQAAEVLQKHQEQIKAAKALQQKQQQQKAQAAALQKQELAKQQAVKALKLKEQQQAALAAQQEKAKAKAKKEQATLDKEIAQEQSQLKKEDKQEDLAAQALAEQKQETIKQAEEKKKAAQKLKLAQQKDLDAQIAQEKQAMEAARSEVNQSEIDKYKALIENAIQQYWVVPGDANPNISCDLLIHVGPGGAVLSVQVARSSGDVGLDNSAKTAVFKASPLPVPSDQDLFDQFRELKLTVKPEILHQQ